jgi:hypothetical protein
MGSGNESRLRQKRYVQQLVCVHKSKNPLSISYERGSSDDMQKNLLCRATNPAQTMEDFLHFLVGFPPIRYLTLT